MKKQKIEIELNPGDEILDRDVNKFGNASHVILPLKHKGKKAKVIISENAQKEKGE